MADITVSYFPGETESKAKRSGMVHTFTTAYELRGLGIRFPGHQDLCWTILTVPRGQFLPLVGPSRLRKVDAAENARRSATPTAGSLISSAMAEDGGHRIGFVFQHPTLLPWRTAEANLQLPMELGPHRNRQQLSSIECSDLLTQVGLLPGDATKQPQSCQVACRCVCAGAALAGRVLLLDEPFAAVDDLLRSDCRKTCDDFTINAG